MNLFLMFIYRISRSQSIAVQIIGEKLSKFSSMCRSLIISSLNLHQNCSILSIEGLQMLILYTPLIKEIFDDNSLDSSQCRLQFSRNLFEILRQNRKVQLEIDALNELLIKSVVPRIEQSLILPSPLFDNPSNSFYEIPLHNRKEPIYIRCLHGQLTKTDLNIICSDHPEHFLAQINYNSSEKYSSLFDIEFKRIITHRDQLTIALPCLPFPKDISNEQQIFIRCSINYLPIKFFFFCCCLEQMLNRLMIIPARMEMFNEIPYAVFRLTQTLSHISVQVILDYPFQILRVSSNGINLSEKFRRKFFEN